MKNEFNNIKHHHNLVFVRVNVISSCLLKLELERKQITEGECWVKEEQ